jgi:transposase
MLFPHLAGLRVERVFTRGPSVRIEVTSEAGKAACPDCGVFSTRVHSRYERRLADMAVGGQELMVHLRARRFLCESSSCPRKTFAERFPELAVPYGRRISVHAVTPAACPARARSGEPGGSGCRRLRVPARPHLRHRAKARSSVKLKETRPELEGQFVSESNKPLGFALNWVDRTVRRVSAGVAGPPPRSGSRSRS